MFIAVATAALTLAACGNKTDNNANADSTATDSTAVADTTATDSSQALGSIKAGDAAAAPASADALAKAIEAKIKAKDAQGLTVLLSNIKARITQLAKTDPQAAKQYVSQLQTYIGNHASEIKAIANGNSTIVSAVDEVKSLNPETVVKNIASAATTDAQNVATSAAEGAKAQAEQAVANKVGEATTQAQAAKAQAEQKVTNKVNNAQKKVNDAANKANQRANDAVNKATNKALKGLGL